MERSKRLGALVGLILLLLSAAVVIVAVPLLVRDVAYIWEWWTQ